MKTLTNIEVLTLCGMSKNQRHEYIFKNVFLPFASDCVKYNRCENGDVTCEYIASGLYTKFLELRGKVAENDDILLDCTQTDIKAVKWTICLLRKVVNGLNFTSAGIYKKVSAMDLQGFTMSIKGAKGETVREYNFNDVHTEGKTIIEKSTNKATKKVDVVDVLKQWENRDSRTEARKVRLFTMYTDEDGNKASEETTIKGNYRNPEEDLIYNCAMVKARRIVSQIATSDKAFNHVYEVLTHDGVLSDSDRMTISRFRKRHNLDDLTLADLRYLFA